MPVPAGQTTGEPLALASGGGEVDGLCAAGEHDAIAFSRGAPADHSVPDVANHPRRIAIQWIAQAAAARR